MTTTTLQRLLRHPHAAVFDKAPGERLALRVRNPRGLVWEVTDSVLRLTTGQSLFYDGGDQFDGLYDWGVKTREYSLRDRTIGQLISDLVADGHEVVFSDAEQLGRGAHVLVDGQGDQDTSNGDHLNAYTSILWALLDAYGIELDEALHQIGQALRQMVLTQAEGEWLDVWAGIYGVPRLADEPDAALQSRIPREVFRERVNGLAIEAGIADYTGFDVRIDEPWKRMFMLDHSALSGADHLQDGRYYTYHVIQPVGREGVNWAKVYPHVVRNKAAGIEIYAPRVEFDVRHVVAQPPAALTGEFGRVERRAFSNWGANNQVLGILRLDDEPPTINHLVARHDFATLSTSPVIEYDGWHQHDGEASYGEYGDLAHVGLRLHQQIEPHRNIAMASIALSESPAFGDENFIFSRGAERFEFDPEPSVSDELALSEYTSTRAVELVEAVTTDAHTAGAVEFLPLPTGQKARRDVRVYGAAAAYERRTWSNQDAMSFDGSDAYDGRAAYSGYTTPYPVIPAWDSAPWVPDWRHAGVKRTDTPI